MTILNQERSKDFTYLQTSSMIDEAIYNTLIYGELFNSPLSEKEIQRYLIGRTASEEEVHSALQKRMLPERKVTRSGKYIELGGKGILGIKRKGMDDDAQRLQERAIRFGRWISHLPFIRMVALTGALAAYNITGANPDFDYFIITKRGYLWVARGLILLLNRFVSERFCPNYLITESNLAFAERDLYTAQELVRMIPISGIEFYNRLREANRWTEKFLPNALGPPSGAHVSGPIKRPLQFLLEPLLDSNFGRRIESWERKRKIVKLSKLQTINDEVSLSAVQCKAHFDGHRASTMKRFTQKMEAIRESGRQ